MKIYISSKGGFDNTLKWLNKMVEFEPTDAMHQIGKDGVSRLASNTPRDTGETASGWHYLILRRWRTTEIAWYNTAHPELNVNMAKLIELGHGTNNGGYVPPRPYMQQAMDVIFRDAMEKIARGMTN